MRGLSLDLERALQGYLSKLDASCSGLGVNWHFHIFTEKASRIRKHLFTSCLEPTQITCLFLLRLCSFSFFFFSFCSVFSDLCLTERVRVNSQDGCTGSDQDEHFYTNRHEDFNMYRSRKRATAWFIPTDSGGLTVHPPVALWSSSVKVYALSHVGKDPCGLSLLSSMIIFSGCWCLSSVL